MTQPFFFGEADEKLFGFFHPPKKINKKTAVLLCYPVGQEYIRIYRSYKLLANQLSANGAHVMRFDYFGTGDSAGASEECNLKHLAQNINLAIEQLKQKSGIEKVSLVAARLGATIAADISSQREDIESLLLLDPVVNGKMYIENLRKTHAEMLIDPDRFSKPRTADECKPNELIGFNFSQQFMQEVLELEDDWLLNTKCDNLYVVNSYDEKNTKDICNNKLTHSSNVHYELINTPILWSDVEKIETTITLQKIGQYIIKKLIK